MQTQKTHIVVVEDESDILDLVTYNLTQDGYEVTGITDGEQALQVIPRKHPQLVLLDLMLPGASGLEICRLLKTKPETSKIPIIMVSAKGTAADMIHGLEMGADDYVTKPFNMKVLLARIHSVLRRNDQGHSNSDDAIHAHDIVINSLRQIENDLRLKMMTIK